MPTRFRGVASVIVLTLGGLLLATAPVITASAHEFPVSSTPPKNGVLTEIPATFDLTMNEDMLDLGGAGSGFALQIVGSDGLYYGDGCLSVAGATMSTPARLGAPGAYTMRWQIVSIDGHAVSDEYPFTWAPATLTTADTGSPTPPICGVTPTAPPTDAQKESSDPAPAAVAADPATSEAPATTASDASSTTPLWIGGGILAAVAIVTITLIVVERRRGPIV